MCRMDSPALPTDFISLYTDRHTQDKTQEIHTVHMFIHTTPQHAPSLHNPVPLENSDLTELEVRSTIYVTYSSLVLFDDSFYLFSVEYHCTSNYLKRSRKMTNVNKKNWITSFFSEASEELNAPPVPV